MSREVRRVPADWQHPREGYDGKGFYRPLYDEDFKAAAASWKAEFAEWESRGPVWQEAAAYSAGHLEYWEQGGNPPDRREYRPAWTDAERTHYQLYEAVTAGTPLSPPCASPEELAEWLAGNGIQAYPGFPLGAVAGHEEWLAIIRVMLATSARLERMAKTGG